MNELQWVNQRTGEWESFNGNWKDYLPQYPEAFAIFDIHIRMGKTPQEAALDVMQTYLGIADTQQEATYGNGNG